MYSIIHWLESHLLTCPYKAMTGLDCPGCGMQRSFIELLKGDLFGSLSFYPALMPVIFTLFLTCVHLYFKLKNGAEYIKYSFIVSTSIIFVSWVLKLIA